MATARSKDEQRFWDEVFITAFPLCMNKRTGNRDPQGCAHLAREQADAALIERRKAQTNGGVK